jgi:hypothetical protein
MKNGLGNLAARDVDQLAAIIKNRLKRIQYRPALIDGFLAQTGLSLEPQPPQRPNAGPSISHMKRPVKGPCGLCLVADYLRWFAWLSAKVLGRGGLGPCPGDRCLVMGAEQAGSRCGGGGLGW